MGEARRTLGVVGTLVWDTIHRRDGREETTEEWGGIGYTLQALSVALPEGWEVLPLRKVGRDLSEGAFRYLREIPRVRVDAGVKVVPEPNNRVELRYQGLHRQAERLSGGVPPWEAAELSPLAGLCDALYVNFITGFEMELQTAQSLRMAFRGPIYADLHSLFLGVGRLGDRIPRVLPDWAEWLHSFDAVQMNEDEFELLGKAHGDPWALASGVVGPDLKLIAVTLGGKGAAYIAGAGFSPDPFAWGEVRKRIATPGTPRSGKVGTDGMLEGGDPTGCGDVWGATFFGRLLSGESLEKSMAAANLAAGMNLRFRGARGLAAHLAGRMS
jgi:hypothetical protein